MKILYAASRNYNAKIQLARFLEAVQDFNHQIKIAAYKISSPPNINIDWTLDALLNIYRPELLSLNNDNLEIYFEQIKNFSPDLIISDLEYFTSYLANLMNVPLWQCSSSLINCGLELKYDLGWFKYYAHSLNRDPKHTQRTANLIENSDCNLIYSHFGDTSQAPELLKNFEWIRPYHKIYKLSVPCQHYMVARFPKFDATVVDVLSRSPDSVVFMEHDAENYRNVRLKNSKNEDEYYCNLRNSSIFICQGQTSFLADAFYNEKFSLIYPDYEDAESIINSHLSDKLGTGCIVSSIVDPTPFVGRKTPFERNDSIKYLHQKIEEL